jgi:ubiquitin carboxyl-terminal hydrolase 9/13
MLSLLTSHVRLASVSSTAVATLVSNDASTPAHSEFPHHSGTLVHRLFEGTLTSETRCLTCETVGLPCSHHDFFGACACRIPARELADACQRYLPATNRFSISRLISSKTRVSLHACASLALAKCCASAISFSVTAVAGYRRPKSGTSFHLCPLP